MSKSEKSGPRVAKIAAATLRDPGASKTAKSLAGSTVAQAHTAKQSSAATARIAAKALNDGRTSAATRAMAGSVLTQKTKKHDHGAGGVSSRARGLMRHRARTRVQVYLGAPGCDAETFRCALGLAVELAASGGYAHLTLSVPTLGHTQGDFDDVLGEAAASKLRRHYRLTAGKLTIHLATSRRRPHFTGPVLAAWTRPEHIRQLLQDQHCATLIVVPWTETDVHHVLRFAPTATRF